MVKFTPNTQRPQMYQRFEHDVPAWFQDSGLGIFAHWGSYSVPAWAKPLPDSANVNEREYWTNNPYAEWYWNTLCIPGSPTAKHHRETYGDMPYERFLDMWKAEEFDPDDMADLFARAGARYFVPTTKHHEGVTLWSAPGADGWNTVERGPHRDLVQAFADAMRAKGLKFGAYYSTGLDWHRYPNMPIIGDVGKFIVDDEDYARYMTAQVMDLIDRFHPDVLWADIDVPPVCEGDGELSIAHIFDHYYDVVPDGVVNDRWGLTHWDFHTVEYEMGKQLKGHGVWQMTRGIGHSFGYNRLEDDSSYMTGPEVIRLLVDVVSFGGNLLLDVGPEASGQLPDLQRACLEDMALWMQDNSASVHGVRPVDGVRATDDPWVRYTGTEHELYALIDAAGTVPLDIDESLADLDSAMMLDGGAVRVESVDGRITAFIDAPGALGPRVIRFTRR